jgi:hypothetical protein
LLEAEALVRLSQPHRHLTHTVPGFREGGSLRRNVTTHICLTRFGGDGYSVRRMTILRRSGDVMPIHTGYDPRKPLGGGCYLRGYYLGLVPGLRRIWEGILGLTQGRRAGAMELIPQIGDSAKAHETFEQKYNARAFTNGERKGT